MVSNNEIRFLQILNRPKVFGKTGGHWLYFILSFQAEVQMIFGGCYVVVVVAVVIVVVVVVKLPRLLRKSCVCERRYENKNSLLLTTYEKLF